jgi:hypothetical protein
LIATSLIATSLIGTSPSRDASRRCSWKARICSSVERSTLRTITVSGTFSTQGAKLSTLVTPAATSRSQTPWAAAAGVATTPIWAPWSRTTDSRSSIGRTGSPATVSPTIRGSASSRQTTVKPRDANPP